MSIIHTFDNKSEEILKPANIASSIDSFPETVILTFKQRVIDIIKHQFKGEEVSYMYAGISIPIYQFEYKGVMLGIYMTIIGGPATVALLEEVLAKGAKKIVVFGSCGVLDKNITAGHIIVPSAAYRDEGTSYHYMKASDYVEVKTAKRLGEILTEIKIPFMYGKTWTTDAFYRETKNNMIARKKEGCITVEMECASLMAASQFRGVELYQYLYAEDSLDDIVWDSRTMGKLPSEVLEKYLRIAAEIAIRI